MDFFGTSAACEFRVHRAGSLLKMSECQTKAGNQECFWKIEKLKTWKLENFENNKNDPWDMLNHFCFHVYAQKQKCQVHEVVKFDPWDMLNHFCFHVDAQKSLFIGKNDNAFLPHLCHCH